MTMWHNGVNSYIKNTTGNLYITDTGGDIIIQAKDQENSILCADDGGVDIYYDNNVKLKTKTDGIESVGVLYPSSNDADDLGKSDRIWRDIYTGDLTLNNTQANAGNDVDGTKGHWKIQEGENDLFIMNKVSGKKFKFKLEEVI